MSGKDVDRMRRKAQLLEREVEAAKKALKGMAVEGTAADGRVRACASGDQTLLSLEIAPELVDRARTEELKAVLLEAVNAALDRSKELARTEIARATGGVRIPGLT